jgi:hypothetical protein
MASASACLFYKKVLKLKPVMKSKRSTYFCAGKIWVALDQREPYNSSENYVHICFDTSKKYFNKFVEEIRNNNRLVRQPGWLPLKPCNFSPCGYEIAVF